MDFAVYAKSSFFFSPSHVAEFIAVSGQPFTVVEEEAFQRRLQKAEPSINYQLPGLLWSPTL